MNVAIIGTGNVGRGLARVFAHSKHGVVVAGRTAESGKKLAQDLSDNSGLTVQSTDIEQAVELADIVVIAVPYGAVKEITNQAKFDGKIVVDATNALNEDFSGLVVGHTSSAAEEIQTLLPKARVVKAYNTVFADIYDQGLKFGDQATQTYVASDDATARAKVIEVSTDAGFDAVDAGPLSNARYIEGVGYLNIQFGMFLGQGTQITPNWISR